MADAMTGGQPGGPPRHDPPPAAGDHPQPDVSAAGGLPPRSRGVIALLEENCTACMVCARECPDWCIYIESHKEAAPGQEPAGRAAGAAPAGAAAPAGPARGPAGRGRRRVRNVLDRFAIDFSLCMYCGICVEVCPYEALFWSPEFSYAGTDIGELTHERDRLRQWMWTVPPPPAHDPGGRLQPGFARLGAGRGAGAG